MQHTRELNGDVKRIAQPGGCIAAFGETCESEDDDVEDDDVIANTTLEERVTMLERHVAGLMERILAPPPEKDWRSTIGTFANDPVMREIQEERGKIRESDRAQFRRDRS